MATTKKTAAKKPAAKTTAKKSTAKKPAAKKAPAKKAAAKKPTAKQASSRAADRADKSIEDFREALERNVTLSRDRLQEVLDDAVKRGRMTRTDANKLVSDLVKRSKKEAEELMKQLEKALDDARKEVDKAQKEIEGNVKKAQKELKGRATKARKTAEKRVTKARKAAVDAADEPLAEVDKVRRKAGAPGFPITAYDELTAAQIKSRIKDLTKADARKVRTHEKNDKARKSILDAIEARLAA